MIKWSKINKSFDQHLGDLKDKLNKDGLGWLVNGIWDIFGYDAGGQFAESAPIPTEGLRYSKNPLFKGQMGKVTAKDLAGAGLEAIGTGAMSKYAEETTDATLALFSILMNATNKRNDLVEKELEKTGGRLTHKKIARAEEKVTESILKEQKTMLGILPDFAKSYFTGRGWEKEGVRTKAGKLVVPADELTSKDIYSKIFLGVNTTKISEAYRKKFEK
jgi:hypothetical protein